MARTRPPRPQPVAAGPEEAAYRARLSHPMYAAPTAEARLRAREAWDRERRKLLDLDLKDPPGKSKGRAAAFILGGGA